MSPSGIGARKLTPTTPTPPERESLAWRVLVWGIAIVLVIVTWRPITVARRSIINQPKEMSSTPTKHQLEMVSRLMKRVYGDWTELMGKSFPIPLPRSDAGPSAEPYIHLIESKQLEETQRRYLWTDAFGVLNFVSLAEFDSSNKDEYLEAGARLIHATRIALGRPRSPNLPMVPNDRGGFIGMRIGKVHAKAYSDAGMSLDGMYWHYIDKWLFCLARFGVATGQEDYVREAAQTAKELHPYFFAGRGVHWKLTSDLKPIPDLPSNPGPSDDAISALVVYSVVDCAVRKFELPLDEFGLTKEIRDLEGALKGYRSRASPDPLGYGLKWWELQWWRNAEVKESLLRIAAVALNPMHLDLPFRLYGALLGAKLSGVEQLEQQANSLLVQIEPRAEAESHRRNDPQFSINAVMFCSAVAPIAFQRKPWEGDVRF